MTAQLQGCLWNIATYTSWQVSGWGQMTTRGSPRIFRKDGGAESGASLTLLSLETGENRPGYPRTRGRGLDEASHGSVSVQVARSG